MEKDYIFCTKCGHKNPRHNKFCVKCGARLVSGAGPAQVTLNTVNQNSANSQINQNPANNKIFNRNNSWMWIILGFLLIIFVSAGYKAYQKQQRENIRSCVYDEFSKSYFKVKIDQEDKFVNLVPYGDQARVTLRIVANLDADGESADEIDDSVKAVSKKIEKKEGDGWTVGLQNPDNSKRYFWIYKDGKCKYRMQDHAVSYDDYGDYGYEDD